ncbi:hypothetical protein C2845_PM17G02160 [Panicum miliaceum]|uniref:OVATE domain-containing protein n=1 Tax=Panicum miliaceum TaxID=4540 RepID=A0A3L6PZQ2_PANMI|nr:hypothetical protein C2845_PM17G02160 [Panicum miliaceum]
MGRKGGLASILSSKPKPDASPSAPWPWPSCAASPQTASFRRAGDRRGHDDDDHRPCTTAGRRRSSEPASAAGRLRPPRKAAAGGDEMYKTVNSVYFDAAADSCSFFFDDDGAGEDVGVDDLDLDDGSFSTTTASEEWSEAVIRSLGRTSTDRFFFDAGPAVPASNSILAASPSQRPSRTTARTLVPPPPEAPTKLQALSPAAAPALSDDPESDSDAEPPTPPTSLVEESVAVALDSEDPFRDFRTSMEEMVAAHGLRDWAQLQEMLLWYLRINGKHNHALIVGAFVDLLVGLATSGGGACASHSHAAATTATTTTSTMTTATTTTSACSTSSSSRSSASGGGGDVNTAGTAAAAAPTSMPISEQCGGGSAGASCSSASSDLEEEDEKRAASSVSPAGRRTDRPLAGSYVHLRRPRALLRRRLFPARRAAWGVARSDRLHTGGRPYTDGDPPSVPFPATGRAPTPVQFRTAPGLHMYHVVPHLILDLQHGGLITEPELMARAVSSFRDHRARALRARREGPGAPSRPYHVTRRRVGIGVGGATSQDAPMDVHGRSSSSRRPRGAGLTGGDPPPGPPPI